MFTPPAVLAAGWSSGEGWGLEGQEVPEPGGKERQSARNAQKRTKMKAEVWFLLADGQEKYFSSGWVRAGSAEV